MTTLDQIKQALFTATNITDALTKLDSLGLAYRECAVCDETYHLLQEDVTFWAPRSNRILTIHVCIGDVIATVDYRQQFFAQQQPDLSKSVPAHDSLAAAEQPVIPEQSTVFVDNLPRDWAVKAYPKTGGSL